MERLPEFIANHLFLFTLLVALTMLLVWNLFGDSLSGVKSILPSELTRMMNHEDAVVIDLRSREQFDQGHIINAKNHPVAEIETSKSKLQAFKQKPLVVVCQNGGESARISRAFKHEGYENVAILKGGLQAWQNANMPLTKQ